jgi:hypothetical protein
MQTKQNRTSILYVDLGQAAIAKEEKELRAQIKHRVAPDNDQIMAYPYPSDYGIDRFINLQVLNTIKNGILHTSYSLAFVHRCLLWQHTRVIDLSADEYSYALVALQEKYGITRRHFISDDNDHYVADDHQMSEVCLYWYLNDFKL